MFSDDTMLAVVNSLYLAKINLKEVKSMGDLNKASEVLSKLGNVRIVQIQVPTGSITGMKLG